MKIVLIILLIMSFIFINYYNDKDRYVKIYSYEDNVKICDSYKIWNINHMINILSEADITHLHRSYFSLVGEWYIHNICYIISDKLINFGLNTNFLIDIRSRTKNVDLERF